MLHGSWIELTVHINVACRYVGNRGPCSHIDHISIQECSPKGRKPEKAEHNFLDKERFTESEKTDEVEQGRLDG